MEAVSGDLCVFNPIQPVNKDTFFVGTKGDDIPSLLEYFQAIGMHLERGRRIIPEALIRNFQRQAISHSLNNGSKMHLSGRYILEQDTLFEPMAFIDQIIDGKRVQ